MGTSFNPGCYPCLCKKKACLKRYQSCETRATPTPSAPPDPNTSQVPLMDMFTPQPLVTPPLVWTSLPTLPTPQSDTTLKAEEDCIAKRTRARCARKLLN